MSRQVKCHHPRLLWRLRLRDRLTDSLLDCLRLHSGFGASSLQGSSRFQGLCIKQQETTYKKLKKPGPQTPNSKFPAIFFFEEAQTLHMPHGCASKSSAASSSSQPASGAASLATDSLWNFEILRILRFRGLGFRGFEVSGLGCRGLEMLPTINFQKDAGRALYGAVAVLLTYLLLLRVLKP